MKPLITALILGASAAAFHPALAADQAAGKKQFDYWCGTCHAPDPREGGRYLPGTASLAVKYKGSRPAALEAREDLPALMVTQVIRHGSEGMPFFRKTEISDVQMDDIAAYLARNTK